MQLEHLRAKLNNLIKSERCWQSAPFIQEIYSYLNSRTLLAVYITFMFAGTIVFRYSVHNPLKYFWSAWLFSGRGTKNAVINLGIMIPLVYLIFKVYPDLHKDHPVLRGTQIGFCASCLIEFTQLVFHRGYFQISDLVNNSISGALGAVLYLCVKRFIQWLNTEDED